MKTGHSSYISPSNYISQKQLEFKPKPESSTLFDNINIAGNLDLSALLDKDEIEAKESIANFHSKNYAKLLYSTISPGLPSIFDKLLDQDIIAVGEINNPIPNAKAVRLDSSRYAVLFNSGLSQFLYRITRAISTRFSPKEGQSNRKAIPFDETCRILTDIFFWYVETNQACGPNYQITTHQLMMASMLAREAESFFLAHELGHIFNEISAIAEQQPNESIELAWQNEFTADEFALNVLLASRNQQDVDVPLSVCYAGAEIAVNVFAGLEALGVKFEESHPSARDRLTSLRKALIAKCNDDQTTYENAMALAEPLDRIFADIIEKLSHSDWQELLDHEASEVIAKLDKLLNRCTGDVVPDYMSFRESMPAIFEQISSYRLYERVASATVEYFSTMDKINSGG